MQVFDRLGFAEKITSAGWMIHRLTLQDYNGEILQVSDLSAVSRLFGFETIALHRSLLQKVLCAQLPCGVLNFGTEVKSLIQGTGSVSVLLADDQPLLRRGFRMIIEAEDDLTVTGEAGDGGEAVDCARRNPPDPKATAGASYPQPSGRQRTFASPRDCLAGSACKGRLPAAPSRPSGTDARGSRPTLYVAALFWISAGGASGIQSPASRTSSTVTPPKWDGTTKGSRGKRHNFSDKLSVDGRGGQRASRALMSESATIRVIGSRGDGVSPSAR